MAKRATQVAEIVTVHRMDSEPLKRGLVQDEALIRQSAAKMQTNMDGMAGGLQNVNAQAITTQQTFGVLGAQAGALGGAFGTATSSAFSFAGALSGIGKAAFGLPGLILAGAAAIGLLVNSLIKQKQAAKEAREEFQAYTEALRTEAATGRKTVVGLEASLALTRAAREGPGAVLRAQERSDQLKFASQLEAAVARTAELQAKEATFEAGLPFKPGAVQSEQLREMNEAILAAERKANLLRSLQTERHAKLQHDLAALTEVRLKRETEAEKRAADERARIHAASPIGRVLGAIQGEIRAALEQQQMAAIFGRLKGLLPEGLRKSIEAKLGIAAPEAAGPAGRVSFAAGGFTDIAAAGGQLGGPMQDVERRKERRDEKRNTDLAGILFVLQVMAGRPFPGLR